MKEKRRKGSNCCDVGFKSRQKSKVSLSYCSFRWIPRQDLNDNNKEYDDKKL